MNYDYEINNGKVMLYFYARWCPSCKLIDEIIDDIKEDFDNIKVIKINIEKNKDYIFKLSIRNIPTVIFMKNGKVINRFSGIITRPFLLKEVKKFSKF